MPRLTPLALWLLPLLALAHGAPAPTAEPALAPAAAVSSAGDTDDTVAKVPQKPLFFWRSCTDCDPYRCNKRPATTPTGSGRF